MSELSYKNRVVILVGIVGGIYLLISQSDKAGRMKGARHMKYCIESTNEGAGAAPVAPVFTWNVVEQCYRGVLQGIEYAPD